MFKSCNIYLKPERFCKSKFTLSKVKSETDSDFTFTNVNFDLRKHFRFQIYITTFKYMSYF